VAWLLLVATVGVGVVAALLLGAGGPTEPSAEEAALTRGRVIVVEARVLPRVPLFGQAVTAELTAVYHRGLIKHGSLSARNDFTPYTLVGPEQHTVSDEGFLTRETWRYRLQCITRPCLPGEPKRQIELQQGQLQYTRLDPGNVLGPGSSMARSVSTIDWPAVDVVSRLTPDATQDLAWQAETRALPGVSYRVDPTLATVVLLGGSGLLGGLALLLLAPLAPRRGQAPLHHEDPVSATPLERALALLEGSRNGAVGERRRTLELLARELRGAGHRDLADRARRLAWSQEEPSPEDASRFSESVRAASGVGAGDGEVAGA
jgi:hypothetical protein